VLQEHPEITRLLDPVFASLTLEKLQEMNARIAVGGEEAASVASEYLREHRFLP